MKSKLGHVYLYVSDLDRSYAFYSNLLKNLGYKEMVKADWGFAFINDGLSIWFEQTPKQHLKDGYHRKRIGLNHLAFRIISKLNVDKFCKEFLEKNKVKTLYGSQRSILNMAMTITPYILKIQTG